MSLSAYLFNHLLTLDSSQPNDRCDSTRTTDETRIATFTLGSSSSSSSSTCSLNRLDELPPSTTKSEQGEHRLLTHSQSLTLECQRRRPVIEDPYRISPDRQLLDDWMIVSVRSTRKKMLLLLQLQLEAIDTR